MSLNGHFQGLEDGCGSASIPISFQRSIILESAVHFLPYPKYHKSTFCTEDVAQTTTGVAVQRRS